MFKKITSFTLMYALPLLSTQVYIKNWSTSPVKITQVSEVRDNTKKLVDTQIAIQPGQSSQLKHVINSQEHVNFDQLTIRYTVDGHTKEQTVYFPDAVSEKATLSFTDSGYKRFPYNNIKK